MIRPARWQVPARLGLICALAMAAMLPGQALGAARHGISVFGDLKYPANFTSFAYVNRDAPKGGRLVTVGTSGAGTFDSLNNYILRGTPADGIAMLFDSLMVRAFDEPDALYGLVAKSADIADDKMSVVFSLRPEARFADGSVLDARDVADTFRLIRKFGHIRLKSSIRDVVTCEAIDASHVRYTFKGKNIRDLPLIVASLPIFSKAWYASHDFSKTTLKAPLGSGPYRVKKLQQGRSITYERRKDYWARDLPVNRGRYNFDEIRLLYFRDRTTEFEALKAGDMDLREEFTSKNWATGYDLNAVKEHRLIRETLPDATTSGAQGFFMNMRREKFSDVRTRIALDLAFDFEWTNAQLFYGLYKRTASFFENSPMKATGAPDASERALLDPLKPFTDKSVFADVYIPPVTDGTGQMRGALRKANKLLNQAGWTLQGTRRVNGKGHLFTIEFLIASPGFERIIIPYIKNLSLLGIKANIRRVDPSQYQERLKHFEFDMIVSRFSMRQTPGTELRSFFSSRLADVDGSFNLAGIKNKAVDRLIDAINQANSRDELVTAARALDRVLRSIHFWVPQWFKGSHSVAYWDMFGRPGKKPDFARGILDIWWVDKEKQAKLRRGP